MSTKQICTRYKTYFRSDKRASKEEGGIRCHLTGSQDRPIPHWVTSDTEESQLLNSIQATPHPITMPGNEVTVKHNAVHQQEHDRLPGHILQLQEGKLGIQWEPDNKGSPRAWD